MEYRLGKKQKRVILDKKGHVVCTIDQDHKHLSNKILNALNTDFNNERILAEPISCVNCNNEMLPKNNRPCGICKHFDKWESKK